MTKTETNTINLKEKRVINGKDKEVNIESKIVISYIQEGGKNTAAHCRVYDTIVP